jgi:hypothetical protein
MRGDRQWRGAGARASPAGWCERRSRSLPSPPYRPALPATQTPPRPGVPFVDWWVGRVGNWGGGMKATGRGLGGSQLPLPANLRRRLPRPAPPCSLTTMLDETIPLTTSERRPTGRATGGMPPQRRAAGCAAGAPSSGSPRLPASPSPRLVSPHPPTHPPTHPPIHPPTHPPPTLLVEWEEWGNPAQPEYYDYMKSYSPTDNVKPQRCAAPGRPGRAGAGRRGCLQPCGRQERCALTRLRSPRQQPPSPLPHLTPTPHPTPPHPPPHPTKVPQHPGDLRPHA